MDNPFKNLSKPQLYAVIGGSTLVAGYAEYAHHKSSGSWNPFAKGAASTNSAGTATTIDPVTGLAYADEIAQYGSVAAAEAAVSSYGQGSDTGTGIPVNPASPPAQGDAWSSIAQ